ncbi:MAG: GNAT family N-acetyltransferase [Chitinophagaceae bacterium]|nr:GNAT family N-acetyltransferase [Chitinophagaceae bacterium]
MVYYTTITQEEEIHSVLQLQSQNLKKNVDAQTIKTEGFVTVEHSFDILKAMMNSAHQIIAKDDNEVIGYALVMLPLFENFIPVLKPMFQIINTLSYKDKPVNTYKYYAIGQICVDKNYRGTGVFENMYKKHKEMYNALFDFCITEISLKNIRSLKAHEKIGFQTIHRFTDATDDWNIVLWDFNFK